MISRSVCGDRVSQRMHLMSLSCALKMVETATLVLCVFHCNFHK